MELHAIQIVITLVAKVIELQSNLRINKIIDSKVISLTIFSNDARRKTTENREIIRTFAANFNRLEKKQNA